MFYLSYALLSTYWTDTMIIVYISLCVQTFIYPGCYIYVYHTFDCEMKLMFMLYQQRQRMRGRTSQSPYLRVRDTSLTFDYVSRLCTVLSLRV